MIASALLAAALATAYDADDVPDVARWIERLGAEAFDDRVAAYRAIERLGASALPALNAAADSGNSKVRSRVRALIVAISRQAEADRFARPTLVRLNFQARPLGEVIAALNDRHDLGLSLQLGPAPQRGMVIFDPEHPNRLNALRNRIITLQMAQPVPYWEAVDRLCQAAALRYDVSPRAALGTSQGALVLMADRTGRGAVSDFGPFRVQVADVRAVFEHDFVREAGSAPKGANARDGGNLTVTLAVLPEPGLALYPNGPVSVAEAVDDQKRSLILPAQKLPDDPTAAYQAAFTHSVSIHASARLLAPDPPGSIIRRLRGKVPVVAVTKRADPIIVKLNEVVGGTSIERPDMTLVVDEVAVAPGTRASVRVTVRPNRSDVFARPRPDRRPPNFAAFNRDRVLERFELRDAAGRKLRPTTSGQTRGADARGFYDRYQLIVTPIVDDGPAGRANATVPSELRYYELVQSTIEIPFDFRDIPMP